MDPEKLGNNWVITWIESLFPDHVSLVYNTTVVGFIILVALLTHWLLHRVILRWSESQARDSRRVWRKALWEHALFRRIAFLLQGALVLIQANLWLKHVPDLLAIIQTASLLWIQLFALLTGYALLDVIRSFAVQKRSLNAFPLKGIFQSIKLVLAILVILLVVATLMNRSPLILLSGLGAMTAVVMLVFKDPILGLVAGIQLSANRMLTVGDWLEMPSHGADGTVMEIGLTTVKVRNWDQTITTIPTYALISESFKNWEGMEDEGGRKMQRHILIDADSVRFLDEKHLSRLHKAKLLAPYLEDKITELERYNADADLSSLVNGRRLTNIGTFRAYLQAYIDHHPGIHKGLITMVRQRQSGPHGIPLEIYAFTDTTAWKNYEGIQADIFDHVFAVMPEFELRMFQSPAGGDVRHLLKSSSSPSTLSEPPLQSD